MDAAEITRARAAAVTIAWDLGLLADDAIVLHNSNKLALRVVPADVFARVSRIGEEIAEFEIALAQRLVEIGSPIVALDPRVAEAVHVRDGFAITLWTYCASVTQEPHEPRAYAAALERLHAGMRTVDIASIHFTDRVAEAHEILASREKSPALSDADRALLLDTLRDATEAIRERGAVEQLLHGEPHPGNVLATANGLQFIDLETGCRGPIEFDLAHTPAPIADCYPGVDRALLGECYRLVLAMVAAWRWDANDQFPDGIAFGERLNEALRAGPPWPPIDAVMNSSR
ncbi:MAG TPA: phosphotransferase [Acidimicrobiia bacterium]|nr:phosphotransferase [Acidimicrobiia bacterium]